MNAIAIADLCKVLTR